MCAHPSDTGQHLKKAHLSHRSPFRALARGWHDRRLSESGLREIRTSRSAEGSQGVIPAPTRPALILTRLSLKAGIQSLAEIITDKVEGQHREGNGHPWKCRRMRGQPI